ncbi:MAG: molybdopterin-dependent oxidoreductase [Anaerolineae bacterium]|nr:molybdopterin-dependent oxidoreductase [Anaerolineae bacterium]
MMINITIDNVQYQVEENITVLEAARRVGVHIPTLCDHPELSPYGGCRLCLVEIDGARTLQPSCTLPVVPNMVVRTNTERVKTARKFILTMIFSERNHFCPYCQVSGGDCELQNAAYGEEMTHWSLQPNWKSYPMDASHEYIILEHNRCILCRRCVRACGELAGNFTLGFEERGADSMLVADLGVPLGESTCISCGTCVQVCPTGALIDRWSAYRGRETQVDHHETICVGCSIGCGIDVLTRDNNLVRIEGDWEAAVNNGVICKVGRFHPVDNDRERILTPLVRKDGKQKATTWDEAIGFIADQIRSSKNGDGTKVAGLISTRLPAETLFQFKELFADQLDCKAVTSLEEGLPNANPTRYAEVSGPFEARLEVIDRSDCIVVLDCDLVDKHEVAGFMVKRTISNGAKLLVLSSEDNKLGQPADVFIKIDKAAVKDVISGLHAALMADNERVKKASAASGVPQDQFTTAAQLLKDSQRPVFIYGKNISADEPDLFDQVVDLKKALGLPRDDYSGLLGLKGKANSLAATQYGLDKAVDLADQKVAFVSLGDDEISQRTMSALEQVPFLAVSATYTSALTSKADVVLPAANWMEQSGHYVNLEGRIQKANASLDAPENIWTSSKIIHELAEALGIKAEGHTWKKELTTRASSAVLFE